MKKIILIGILVTLLAAPKVLAHDSPSSSPESEVDGREDCQNASFHAGNEVEEDHESETAKLHENEDNHIELEDCASPLPTVTSTGTSTPAGTPTATPVGSPTGSPVETATATPTPTETALGISNTQGLQGLLQELLDLLKKLLHQE